MFQFDIVGERQFNDKRRYTIVKRTFIACWDWFFLVLSLSLCSVDPRGRNFTQKSFSDRPIRLASPYTEFMSRVPKMQNVVVGESRLRRQFII